MKRKKDRRIKEGEKRNEKKEKKERKKKFSLTICMTQSLSDFPSVIKNKINLRLCFKTLQNIKTKKKYQKISVNESNTYLNYIQ